MPNSDFTWNIENLRIITFGEDPIPFSKDEISTLLTGRNVTASIKQDENGDGDIEINEVTPLEDDSIFNLSFFEKQNIIEFSLNVNEIKKESLSLDIIFNRISDYTQKFYEEYNFKIKRIGVISELYQTNFDYIKNNISIINLLGEEDDFDIRLNKLRIFNNIKINQAVNFNSAERVFVTIEEPFNVPIINIKRVTRLTIDVNTDIEHKIIDNSLIMLIKLIEISKALVNNEGFYEK